MKVIKCEMCGGTQLVKTGGVYVCQHCGTQYDPEEAKKLMVEVSGTVRIDNSQQQSNLYTLARRARSSGDYASASKYYDQILVSDPDSWEASFYSTFCKAIDCTVAEIASAARLVANCFIPSWDLIKKSSMSEEGKVDKIRLIGSDALSLGDALVDAAVKNYLGIDQNIRNEFRDDFNGRLFATCELFGAVAIVMERYIESNDGCKERYLHAQRSTINALTQTDTGLTKPVKITQMIKDTEAKIQKYDPNYKPQNTFLASAAAGTATTKKSDGSGCGCLLLIIIFIFIFYIMQ